MVLLSAAIAILVCAALSWARVTQALAAGVTGLGLLLVGLTAGGLVSPESVLDLSAAVMLASVAARLGRELLLKRDWPADAFLLAILVVTSAGIFLRADRLRDVLEAPERQLQPDVQYYQRQALRTWSPFAAGDKSPLWPAMHAPLVRVMPDQDAAMRMLSWISGMAMIPAVALALGRLFHPLVGIVVAGTLATDSWTIDLCTQGLREEFGVCLWMLILVLLLDGTPTWRRALGAGLCGGLLLLLRNISLVPLVVITIWAVAWRRWPAWRALAALLLPLLLVAPFYVNQWRAFGDPLAMERRDARYHANLEFSGRTPPPGLNMPSVEALSRDLFAGEPISPAAYLVGYRGIGEFLCDQWRGLAAIITGERLVPEFGEWLRWACAAGVLASLLVPRQRWAGLFVLAGTVGMIAHLQAIGHLEQRLLLPAIVVWLAAGWWLILEIVRIGGRRWLRETPR